MVTGSVLNLLNIRAGQDDCLVLRPAHNPRQQREYLAVVKVDAVNFALMSEGEQEIILAGWRSFLMSQDPKDRLSIHARTVPYNIQPYLETLDEAEAHAESDLYRTMAIDHRHFVQDLAAQRALLQREFYIRIPLLMNVKDSRYRQLRPAEVFDQAKARLDTLAYEVMNSLSRAGITARRLETEELIHYYFSCIHMKNAEKYILPKSLLDALNSRSTIFTQGDTTETLALTTLQTPFGEEMSDVSQTSLRIEPLPARKRRWVWRSPKYIAHQQKRLEKKRTQAEQAEAPDLVSLPELLAPASIVNTPHYVKVHHNAGDEYIRSRAVVAYPAYALAGWFDTLLSIDEPYVDVVLFLETLEPTSYIKSLTRRISGYRATQLLEERHGKTENPWIAAARSDDETLRDQLVQKTELVHSWSLYVSVRATDRQTLRERDNKVLSFLKSLELHSVALEYEHLQSFLALVDSRDILRRVRKLDTSTLVASMPFCSSDLSTEPGVLIGMSHVGSLVIINPTSSAMENGHELVFARSGAGKSYYRKTNLIRSLLLGFAAIVIDPEDEYEAACTQFGGSSIKLSPNSLRINPFFLARLEDSERNALEEKFQMLLVLFDLLLAEKDAGVLSQKEKGYLNRLLMRLYAEHGISADPATHSNVAPNMQELYDLLVKENDPYGLADRLARFLPSFPAQTEVDLDNRLVVFHLRDLPTEQENGNELRRAALFLITNFVWEQVRSEKHPRKRLLLIDEAWTLVEYAEGGRFLASLSRRARKYNLHLRLVTQAAEDFLGSEYGRTILLNCAMKFLMKQSDTSIDVIQRAFKLSDQERAFLLQAGKGEGLFFCRSSHIPIRIVSSALEHRLANTDPEELRRLEQALHQEYLEQQELEERNAVAVTKRQNEYDVLLPLVYSTKTARENHQE